MNRICRYIFALTQAAGISSLSEASVKDTQQPAFSFYGEILGGYFSDDALKATAGRETQIWKMTRVILGTNIEFRDQPWSARIELAPLGDEVEHKPGDAAYVDYYKNLGTDLLYYGDYPLREAFVRYQQRFVRVTVGRMVNLYGLSLQQAPYQHRHDAPHAYFIDKELVTGARLDLDAVGLTLSLGVFGGRGDPGLSYNRYLNGATDPNTKDNNTPLVEAKLSYHYQAGGFSGAIYAGYRDNKTGSAYGSLYDGKHNDERMNAGVDLNYDTALPVLTGLRLLGQYNSYTFGLTESGAQGNATEKESLDIDKTGYFATAALEFFDDFQLQYTYEKLDRMDTKVWDEIARFDPGHPAFESEEINHIVSLGYRFMPSLTLSAFYRKPEFDYQEVSGIRAGDDVTKMGVTLGLVF